MPKPTPAKSRDKKSKDQEAQAARERELQQMIEQVEKQASGLSRPKKESPHDFVERRSREISKK
jgi:hypothetical protein